MSVLIWDFDKTLGERIGGWSDAILDALNATGLEHRESVETIRPHLQSGYPWHSPDVVRSPKSHTEWWQDLGETVFLPYFVQVPQIGKDVARELSMTVERHYLQPDKWRLFDGALQSLQWAKDSNYTNVLLTNNAAGFETVLESLEISPFFDMVVNSANTGAEKPHPHAWQPILDCYRSHELSFMIGDSLSADIAGASALGIHSILVGKVSEEATLCVTSVAEIPVAIDQFERNQPLGR